MALDLGCFIPVLMEFQTPALLLAFAYLWTQLVLPALKDLMLRIHPQTHTVCSTLLPWAPVSPHTWTSHWTPVSSRAAFCHSNSQESEGKSKAFPGPLLGRNVRGNEHCSLSSGLSCCRSWWLYTAPKLKADSVHTPTEALGHKVIACSRTRLENGGSQQAHTLRLLQMTLFSSKNSHLSVSCC